MRPTAFLLIAGTLTAAANADVVIQPTAVTAVSTWRSCVPQINVINGNGLSNAALVTSGSAIPAAWPSHGTDGCNNMWHTSCIGQSGSTCEGGATADLTPYIIFDLGAAWDVTGLRLWNHNQVAPGGASETNRGIRNMEISVSTDNVTYSSPVPYTNVSQGPGSTAYSGDTYGLVAANVRYVKIQVTQNWGATGVTGISEIRFTGNSRLALANAAVAPATVEMCGSQNVVVSTRVIPGPAPIINVVLSGGPTSGFPQLNDQGADGDAVAGDGIWSATVNFPANYPLGVTTFNIATEDTAGHSATTTADVTVAQCVPTYTENGDAGETLDSAALVSGSGPLGRIRGSLTASDTDLYKITLCDNGSGFSASTYPGTTMDTQLFLFDANGVGVAFDDDVPVGLPGDGALQSTIYGSFFAGDYYLAVTLWDRDPQDASAQDLWQDTPYNVVRGADGPGAANPLAAWTGTFGGSGNYTIDLVGACFVSSAPPARPTWAPPAAKPARTANSTTTTSSPLSPTSSTTTRTRTWASPAASPAATARTTTTTSSPSSTTSSPAATESGMRHRASIAR
ncbi:MAG: hypothetical protein QM783_09180 [Phycisphaerales bacterium]